MTQVQRNTRTPNAGVNPKQKCTMNACPVYSGERRAEQSSRQKEKKNAMHCQKRKTEKQIHAKLRTK
jgi:hypothetical protein